MDTELGSEKGMSGARLAVLGVLVGAVALLGLLGYRLVQSDGGSFTPQVNSRGRAGKVTPRPASDFTLRSFDGELIRLSDLRGKVVVLNFWSSWCAPCREEAAHLEQTWRKYKDQGVALVGAGVWDKEADAKQFLLEQGITYPNGLPEGKRPMAAEYGLTGIPETFVIDPEGNLVKRWYGPVTDAELGEMIRAARTAAAAR